MRFGITKCHLLSQYTLPNVSSNALTRVFKNAYAFDKWTSAVQKFPESKTFCQQFWLPHVVARRRLCCEVEVIRPYTRQRRLAMASDQAAGTRNYGHLGVNHGLEDVQLDAY